MKNIHSMLYLLLCITILATPPLLGGERSDRVKEEADQFLPLEGELEGQFGLDPTYARSLSTFYQRRQYPGAPPFIPHPTEGLEFEKNQTCQSCHEKGGYVKKLAAYAPLTPHPERVSCQQCHVAQRTDRVFKRHDWTPIASYDIKKAAISGGPPGIPHELFGRGACLTCHGGPGAIREIKTSHPERVHCRQCHVSLHGQ